MKIKYLICLSYSEIIKIIMNIGLRYCSKYNTVWGRESYSGMCRGVLEAHHFRKNTLDSILRQAENISNPED
jgi:hypothetical protein